MRQWCNRFGPEYYVPEKKRPGCRNGTRRVESITFKTQKVKKMNKVNIIDIESNLILHSFIGSTSYVEGRKLNIYDETRMLLNI